MPSDEQRYDAVPPIPTYDEAIAGGSSWRPDDERNAHETESQSLLCSSHHGAPGSSRRPSGYRPPTVETDDEDSDWTSDDDETAQVRRELQEMEIEEQEERSTTSIWGKRIPFSLSLPSWKWTWRWRLPRPRIRLPLGPSNAQDADTGQDGAETRRRWNWPKVNATAMFILFARILTLFLVIGLMYVIFASDVFNILSGRLRAVRPNPEDLRIYLMSHIDEDRLRASVQMFSSYAHVAGTEGEFAHALDVEEMFFRVGMDEVVIDEYEAYLNYPTPDGRAVEILDKDGKSIWTAKLDEEERGGEQAGHQTLAFHGHSKSGQAQGPLIYANYGSRDDFKKLQDSGIDTKGAIALVRYYGNPEDISLKVKAAEMAGFAGCIVYNDPADNGFVRGDVAPNGRFLPADGVERGSVSLTRWVMGDVLTPGWASKKKAQRVKLTDAHGLVGIPSLPLASRDAQVLLQHLRGFGQKVPDGWAGAVPDIGQWWTGNASSPIVHLKNLQDEIEERPIRNIYGKIQGIETREKSIIIGNHRDAWAFGATDTAGGTAVMIELARIFGDLRAKGWIPLRSIEFMSWDASEYNLIGSTEFVERNEEYLRDNAYAYIDVSDVVVGQELHMAGSPLFNKVVLQALDRVWDPNFNTTLRDLWDRRGAKLETLDCRGDYLPFQAISGTPSLHLSFRGDRYPKHSSYNNFAWVENVADPGFLYHRQMAELVGLLMLELADRYILPLDVVHFGEVMDKHVDELHDWTGIMARKQGKEEKLDLLELKAAVAEVKGKAGPFAQWELAWDGVVLSRDGYESAQMAAERVAYNQQMGTFESALLDPGGIPDRAQYKHVVFGPSRWETDPERDFHFPAIRQLVEDGDWEEARKRVGSTAGIIRQAAAVLEPPA